MSRFWKAVIGGIFALLGVWILCAILGGIGFEATGGAILVFAVLIGVCTGLIIGKLDKIECHLCTLISRQEKIGRALKCDFPLVEEAPDQDDG